jgi:F-type H+-transporting ATPase subunit epsilon
MSHLSLEIISMYRRVFDGNAVSITVPGTEGELTILPHHIPLITPLKAGEIKIKEEGGKEKFLAIGNGFVMVENNKVSILADSADLLDELTEEKILEAKKRAETALKDKKFADDRAFADTTALLEQSIAQLKVLKKRKKSHH